MKYSFFAVLIILSSVHSRAAVLYELDPEIRRMTEQILREKNVDYRDEAVKRLRRKGEQFDRARIEVTGVMSGDDTYRFNPSDFDGQVKPSFAADTRDGLVNKIQEWARRAREPYTLKDVEEMKVVMRGEMNQRAVMAVAPYRGMEINEIVAHSWGSELIYAAILNGEILPPKKLIVVGVPDNDMAKWRMLAARTGTEVHWARADNDAVALDAGVKIAKEEAGSVDFKVKWDALCSKDTDKEKKSCHAHDRKSKPMIVERIGILPGVSGHARTDYYDLLKRANVIKGTVNQLRVLESIKIDAETEKVEQDALNEAHKKAEILVSKARELADIVRREHDERLKNTWADIAQRSCANPGSITQAELDGLPKSKETDVMDTAPRGLGECGGMVYGVLLNGGSAADLIRVSTPRVPIPVPQAVPVTPPVRVDIAIPFSSVFPGLRSIAVTACSFPGQVVVESGLIQPSHPFSFSRDWDDRNAERLSAGLGGCQRQVFQKLIDAIRSGRGPDIDSQWVRDRAAEYSRPQGAPSFDYSPPTGCIPGDNSRRNCIACGNSHCD